MKRASPPVARRDSGRRASLDPIRVILRAAAIGIAACAAALVPAPALADERILDFFSDVRIERNGDLLVTENITLNAEGNEIQRGILRDFPTTYIAANGTRVRIGLTVEGIQRDGAVEPYALEALSNGVRMRIGSADTLLDQGRHVYAITYRTTRQLGFFPEFDELYWNVTGNGWTFPIDRARARITLPEPAAFTQHAVYTGPQGSREQNAAVTRQAPGVIEFQTTAPLDVAEGLTVAAAFPKGIVAPPQAWQQWLYRVRDNLPLFVSVAGFLLIAAYYVTAWRRGQRRDRATLVPRYDPPDALSAPAVRYIARQRFDDTTYVVGMLQLIGLRALRMTRKELGTEFERVDADAPARNRPGKGLPDTLADAEPDGESAASTGVDAGASVKVTDKWLSLILRRLFRKDRSFIRETVLRNPFESSQSGLREGLSKAYDDILFAPNRRIATRGVQLWLLYLVACLAAAWWQFPPTAYALMASLPFVMISVAVLTAVIGNWIHRGRPSLFALIGSTVMFLPMLLGGLGLQLASAEPRGIGALPGLLPMILFPVVLRAYHFLRRYTPEGDALMDQIRGFKRYLTVAEGPRLQALVTPQEKLEVYERFLPYAVALDVGKAWARGFEGLFAGVAGMAMLHSMEQRYGGHDMLRDPGRGTDSFGGTVTATPPSVVSSSSSSPGSSGNWSSGSSSSSSSSGSSGGGSSGGGGGGGGGSGW